MLFTTELAYKSVWRTYLTVPDSHHQGKDTVVVLVDLLCNHFGDPGAVNIIWSDGTSSEFKIKFIVKFLQSLIQKHEGLSHRNTLLQAMGKRLLMELEAKLRL